MTHLTPVIQNARIVVMIGAGGVGKTTTSVAIAMLFASLGKRVALLSIDPAKRLASALGIPLGNTLSPVEFPGELNITGSLMAGMLDQKAVFDSMVHKHASSPGRAAKILAHPLYQAASTNLAGPLEYMALAKLEELSSSDRYDVVVLDTPPDTHALDFLERPNILSGFAESKVMSWLIKPFLTASRFGLGRFMDATERLMGGISEVTGVKALRGFAEFLELMQDVILGFSKNGEVIVQKLKSPTTKFVLVATPTRSAQRSVLFLAQELKKLSYAPSALILNKCLPSELSNISEGVLGQRATGERLVSSDLKTNFSELGLEEGVDFAVVSVEDQDHEIGSLRALQKLVDQLR